MPRRGSPYGPFYAMQRAALLGRPCVLRLVCGGAPADSADHDPPLCDHFHREGSGCCQLRPACMRCQHEQGGQLRRRLGTIRQRPPRPSRAW